MKKKYQTPTMDIVAIYHEAQLLTGSNMRLFRDTEVDEDDPQYAPDFGFDD